MNKLGSSSQFLYEFCPMNGSCTLDVLEGLK
jgi:hypothetical protein